jgi:hypothetical protein
MILLNKMSLSNQLKCKSCEYVATSKRGLTVHVSKMHSVTIFNCGICKKQFSSRGNLTKHNNLKHSDQVMFTKEQMMKEQELLQAKQEAEILKVKNQAKDEVTAILQKQLEKAESKQPKIIKHVTTNNITLNTSLLEPITHEKLFRGVQNFSKQAALNNKLPNRHTEVIHSLYNQNPRSFIASDKSRYHLQWVDGDDNNTLIETDVRAVKLAEKLNYAINDYKKDEDPFADLIQVIDDKRLSINCEEDSIEVSKAEKVIKTLKTKDVNVISNLLIGANNLIELAPKSIEATPFKLKESLKMLMDEFKKSFMFEPFKVIIQSPDAVGQWIRNTLDYFGNVVINEINLKIVLNKQKDTEMVSFDDLFASIRYVLKVIGSKDDETFDFDYCHDHILLKHKKYLQSKEEARENAQAFREWIQTGNFEYQDKLYNMIQKNIRV